MNEASLSFAVAGERVQRASAVLESLGPQLAMALRRALPFVGRRGVPVTLAYARAEPLAATLRALERPLYALPFRADPGGAPGAIVLDGTALAMVLDGIFGGDGKRLPSLDPAALSPAQSALALRAGEGLVRAFSDVLAQRLGVRLAVGRPSADAAESESAPVVCALELGNGDGRPGKIVIALAKELLLSALGPHTVEAEPRRDPAVARTMEDVEIELVARLGHVRMRLPQLAALKPGDTLRLDVPVNGLVDVTADEQVILRGRPTTHGGQIAIRVERHGR